MNQTATQTQTYFVICIRKGDDDDLELRQAYVVLPAADNEAGFLRIVDESGEDYLYPAEYFQPIELPQSNEQVWINTSSHQTDSNQNKHSKSGRP